MDSDVSKLRSQVFSLPGLEDDLEPESQLGAFFDLMEYVECWN